MAKIQITMDDSLLEKVDSVVKETYNSRSGVISRLVALGLRAGEMLDRDAKLVNEIIDSQVQKTVLVDEKIMSDFTPLKRHPLATTLPKIAKTPAEVLEQMKEKGLAGELTQEEKVEKLIVEAKYPCPFCKKPVSAPKGSESGFNCEHCKRWIKDEQ